MGSWIRALCSKLKSASDRTALWAIEAITPVAKVLPLSWLLVDTIISMKYFRSLSLKDHLMRVARFGMGMGYFMVIPHPQLALFMPF